MVVIFPASHAVHLVELSVAVTFPASHAVQVALLVAPVAAEYVPASHAAWTGLQSKKQIHTKMAQASLAKFRNEIFFILK